MGGGGGEGPESFPEFVTRQQQSLLRLAFLLTGDRGHAEDLAQTALMKTYRHWDRISRRGEPSAHVRRALVTTHTSWRRRARHRQQPTGRLPDVAAAEPAGRLGAREDLRRALAALPPRMRATVVLRYYEDLSELRTAQLMGCSESTVNTQAARGLARLRSVLITGEELRDRLHELAETAGRPVSDGPGLARRIARDAADRRRSRRNLLIGVGCLVLLGIAVRQLADNGSGAAVPTPGPVSAPSSAVAGGASAAPEDVDIFGLPTRGSLAGDRTFVDGVRALSWIPATPPPAEAGMTYYPPDPPLETRSVVFAGEVSGERWALVVGRASWVPPDVPGAPSGSRPPDELVAAWFTGPRDAGPAEMTLRNGPSGIPPDWPMAMTDPRTGAVVVVAAPGDVVKVSERPRLEANGGITREWQDVETVDGIAITRVSPSRHFYDASTSYRVLRGGRTEARAMPWSFVSDEPGDPVPIEYPRGRPSDGGEQAAQNAAQNILAELGLSPAEVEITAPWVGGLAPGDAGQAAVVTVTVPSGAVVVEGEVLLPDQAGGQMSGAFCGQAILPAGPPIGRRVLAMACEVFDYGTGAPVSTTLVAVGPPEVALYRTYDGARTFLSEHAAVDGVLVVPLPVGTDTVEAVTAGGVTLGRVELLEQGVNFGD